MKKILATSCIAVIIAFVIVISIVLDKDDGLPKAQELEQQAAELKQQKEVLDQRLYILDSRLNAMDTLNSRATEQTIRSQLNMIHEDEVMLDLSGANTK